MKRLHLFVVVGLLAALAPAVRSASAPKPNIVVIISDDQGWQDYSFMGHAHIKTPALDQLAAGTRDVEGRDGNKSPAAAWRGTLQTIAQQLSGDADTLRDNPELLDSLLGVARKL